jgi:dihydrofolate synthase/folylpolyglutamate synthase
MPKFRRFRTIDQALDYLYSFINYEVDSSAVYGAVHYNLERTLRLLDLLGNPERDLRFIHVAGTKGKGSVCAVLDALLRTGNHRTGVFISPHVDRVNERIAVDGLPISDRSFVELINLFPPLIETFAEEPPTTFEILTAMAVRYFRERGVEYAILETGMGGRFDSTNFCNPCVSVITSISYDHMDKLGDRIEDIAGEKAGIIKPGKPVVLGYQVYDVTEVFSARARALQAPLYRVDEHCVYEIVESSERGSRFDTRIDGRELPSLFLSLPGHHQVENALVAMLGLEVLGLLPGPEQLREALASLSIPTRLELIEGERRFLLDSAHNRDSARVVADTLQEAYRYDRLITIAGVVKGKDIEGILGELARVSDWLIITEPVTHKELDTDLVISTARTLQPDAVLIPDISRAIAYAVSHSGPGDLILVTGSFYTTSPARRLLLHPDKGRGK